MSLGRAEASQKGPLSDPKKLLDDLFEFDKARTWNLCRVP